MRVILGTNVINDCDAALVVNGAEVFRLRDRGSDGQLICDFDLRAENGDRIAKIAKNRVVHVADGFEWNDLPKECYVSNTEGVVLARVVETTHDEITITGDFWVEGHHVAISDESLVSGGVTMAGNVISGFGKAISIAPNSFSIGSV